MKSQYLKPQPQKDRVQLSETSFWKDMSCRLHKAFWCILTVSPFHHKMSQHSNIWLLGCMDQHLIALGIWKRELFLSEISWRTNIAKLAKYIEWSCPCEINSNSMSHPHSVWFHLCSLKLCMRWVAILVVYLHSPRVPGAPLPTQLTLSAFMLRVLDFHLKIEHVVHSSNI